MKKKLSFLFLFSIFLLGVASAYMPPTHTYIADNAILSTPGSSITQLIKANYDDFIACDILADISVFYYFNEGFSSISKTYKQTHSVSLCERMVEGAVNDQELACAYGVCSHYAGADYVSHNKFVPEVVKKTKLVNGLVHIFAEEDVNDKLIKKEGSELDLKTRQALSNKAHEHKEFFRENLVLEGSDFPFDAMFDAFVSEVTGESKYSVGFKGFTAIPGEIHITVILFFLANTLILAFLVRKKKKSIFNYISMGLTMFFALLVIFAYILFYTGNLWVFFQWASAPISGIMPTSGWESYVNEAIQINRNLLSNGYQSAMAEISDPAGEAALRAAGEAGSTVRIIVDIVLIILVILFVWLNFRRKKHG